MTVYCIQVDSWSNRNRFHGLNFYAQFSCPSSWTDLSLTQRPSLASRLVLLYYLKGIPRIRILSTNCTSTRSLRQKRFAPVSVCSLRETFVSTLQSKLRCYRSNRQLFDRFCDPNQKIENQLALKCSFSCSNVLPYPYRLIVLSSNLLPFMFLRPRTILGIIWYSTGY